MAFYSKEYDAYVILSGPRTIPPWSWEKWSAISTFLEPFTITARGKISLRTTQISKDSRKKIPFGKLGWDDESHSRWTHGSPITLETSRGWLFLSAEAWAPSWTLCEKNGEAPDFFISLRNAPMGDESNASQFGAVLILALSGSEVENRRSDFRMAVSSVAKSVASPLIVWKRRTWGRPFGAAGFTDALNDLAVTGLFKVGNPHQRLLDAATFAEEWNLLT